MENRGGIIIILFYTLWFKSIIWVTIQLQIDSWFFWDLKKINTNLKIKNYFFLFFFNSQQYICESVCIATRLNCDSIVNRFFPPPLMDKYISFH